MSEKKEGWYIFVHTNAHGGEKFELAHFVQGEPPKHAAICGQPTPFDLSGMEPWDPHNPQHIHEIRQHKECQSAIAVRDGRVPIEVLHAEVAKRGTIRARRPVKATKSTG